MRVHTTLHTGGEELVRVGTILFTGGRGICKSAMLSCKQEME